MFSLRDVVVFFAGAVFFHTISHIMLPNFIALPWDMNFMILTKTMNYWIIGVSAVITLLLLWWASKLPR